MHTLLVAQLMSLSLAHPPPVALSGPIRPDFSFPMQGQISVLTTLPRAQDFGGIEVQLNASLLSIGFALGFGWEILEPRDEVDPGSGGFVDLAFQWRMAQLLDSGLYRWFDPHIDLGGLLGGTRRGGELDFRGALYLGAALELGLAPGAYQPVLGLHYRLLAAQTPEAPTHQLLVSVGFRGLPQ